MKLIPLLMATTLTAAPALAADVSYDVGGEAFTGYYAAAESAKGLVLIVHDWDGMTDYERQRADMLADMGYDAFALDMFGDSTPTDTVDHRRAATGALFKRFDNFSDHRCGGDHDDHAKHIGEDGEAVEQHS